MSLNLVRAALETGLAAISPAIATAYENISFTPPAPTVPYQRVWLLTADPDNPEASNGYTERGYMQVDLCYPLNGGPSAATTHAQLIRDTFKRGSLLTSSTAKVTIERTPTISGGSREDDRHVVRVKIPFYCHIPRS